MVEDTGEGHGVFFRIAAVVVDAVDNELLLFGLQELVCFCGEVDDNEPSEEADSAGYGAFDDEDP